MSNIPSNAMPHAGGTTTAQDNNRNTINANHGGNSRQSHYASETSLREESTWRGSGDSWMDKARDNKGMAIGIAVGAVAAAAIPFMLSGRKKGAGQTSSTRTGQQYDYDVTTGKRSGTRAKA